MFPSSSLILSSYIIIVNYSAITIYADINKVDWLIILIIIFTKVVDLMKNFNFSDNFYLHTRGCFNFAW